MRSPFPKDKIEIKSFVSKVKAIDTETGEYEWTWTATCICYDDDVKVWSRKVPNLKTKEEVDEMLALLRECPDTIPGRQVLFF